MSTMFGSTCLILYVLLFLGVVYTFGRLPAPIWCMQGIACLCGESTVVGIDDWYVLLVLTLGGCNDNDVLLPTCLSAAWRLAVTWVCWAEFAIDEITFYLPVPFRLDLIILKINTPLRPARIGGSRLLPVAPLENCCTYQSNPMTASTSRYQHSTRTG